MASKMLGHGRTMFFLCDIQERFRKPMYEFDKVVDTTNKMLRIAKILGCEVVVTEQHPKALGSTAQEIDLVSLGSLHLGTFSKTAFSMVIPEVKAIVCAQNPTSVVLFGIESHVCVLQTALELIELGIHVHVLADGVSSCNKEEIPLALSRIQQAGGHITTSESAVFQLARDAGRPEFKAIAGVIKEEKERTREALVALTGLSRL